MRRQTGWKIAVLLIAALAVSCGSSGSSASSSSANAPFMCIANAAPQSAPGSYSCAPSNTGTSSGATATPAVDGANPAGTSAWPGQIITVTSGTLGHVGCVSTAASVTTCPMTGLVGICKQTTSIGAGMPGNASASTVAFYFYSAAYTAASARTTCTGSSTTDSGISIITTTAWYTQP